MEYKGATTIWYLAVEFNFMTKFYGISIAGVSKWQFLSAVIEAEIFVKILGSTQADY